jgi:hypothetical protein
MLTIRSRVLLAALAASATIAVAGAPAAHAWPKPPSGRFAPGCVKQSELSFQLRVVARRVFGAPVCVPPLRVRITSPAAIAPAFTIGKLWCTVTNARPGAPLGSVLSLASAARFCARGSRGWAYVRW